MSKITFGQMPEKSYLSHTIRKHSKYLGFSQVDNFILCVTVLTNLGEIRDKDMGI